VENKKWTKEEAEQNKNNLIEEIKEMRISENNLELLKKELNQLIDEEEVRQNNKTIKKNKKMVEQEILDTFISETSLGEFSVINPIEQDLIIGFYESKEDAEKAFNEHVINENIIFE
jgi:23S rRNA-/tRNA-specific pseudouridylate synthase